ncbi:MAG: polyamine ABC transporter substrate-binding protein [Succinivibrionaceae bacterium]
MSKYKCLLISSMLLFLGLNCSFAEEPVLNIYNWSDYIEPSVITEFEKETGIKVVYDVFDSNEVLEAKVLSGKTGYDIVVPGSDFLSRQIVAGVYQPLQKDKLPNYKNLDPVQLKFLSQLDPDNTYSIPYMVGTTGIAYNKKEIEARLGKDFVVDSWEIFFNPEILSTLKDCGVAVLNAGSEVIPTALHYLGKDPMSQNLKDYKEAESLLIKMRDNVTYFHSSQNINDLANGDICITLGWSGDLFIAKNRAIEAKNGVEIEYIVPKEGALIFYDVMAIPKDAEHPENAHKFIDFIMRPEIVARISSYVSYANGNKASKPFVIPEVRDNPNIFIPEEKMEKMFIKKVLPQKINKEITKIWSRVKSGK